MVSRQPCREWVKSLDLFVSSAGTGQVINSSPQSLLVPELPLCSPFYISRTFQSPHLLQQHFPATVLPPLSGNSVWKQHLLLCSPDFSCFRGYSASAGQLLPADTQGLYPALILGQDPEEAARGSTDKERGRGTEDFSSQSSLPSQRNSFISRKWRTLKFYIPSLAELLEN